MHASCSPYSILSRETPWFALLLLLLTHGLFGWLMPVLETAPWIWIVGAVSVVLIALALTAPLTLIQNFYRAWLKSDTSAFISTIVGAFIVVVILCWLPAFIRVVALITAGALVRLELQTRGYGRWRSFGIIAISSLTGYSFGLLLHQLVGVRDL